MSLESNDATPQASTKSTVQLSLLSLVLVSGLSGFCGGLAWAIITTILDLVGFIGLTKFSSYIVNLITFPLIGLFFGAFFSFIGYPIYKWCCRKMGGQKLFGLFTH